MAPAFFDTSGSQDGAWILFFLVSLCARLFGRNPIFRYLRLPTITGYMIIGVIFGPYLLGVMDDKQVFELKYVTQAALGFIAISAGAEIYIPEMQPLLSHIGWITTNVLLFTMILVTLFMFGVGGTPFLSWLDVDPTCKLGAGLLAGVVCCARSPSAVIAVMREMKAKGRLSAINIGVIVLGDVVALVLFAIFTSTASNFCSGEAFDVPSFLVNIVMLKVAIIWGAIVGLVIIQLLKISYAKYLILPIGLLCFMASDYILETSKISTDYEMSIDGMLMCIVAGFVVGNSPMREKLLAYLASLSKYIFIPFFVSVGLQLNLPVLFETIGFAVVMVLVRLLAMFLGTLSGGVWVGLEPARAGMMWMGLIPQAGVALSLSSNVARAFQDTWGKDFQSTVVGAILLNQVFGPLICKYFLSLSGEAGKAEQGETNGFKHTIAAAELNDGENIGDPEFVEFETQTEEHLFLMAEKGDLFLAIGLGEENKGSEEPGTDIETGSSNHSLETEADAATKPEMRPHSPLRIIVPRPPPPPADAEVAAASVAGSPALLSKGFYAAVALATPNDRDSVSDSASDASDASGHGGLKDFPL